MKVYLKKRDIFNLTFKHFRGKINKLHVISVLSLLVEEIIDGLNSGKGINIPNFGEFTITKFNPKRIKMFKNDFFVLSKAYNALRFRISKKLKTAMFKEINKCEEKKE